MASTRFLRMAGCPSPRLRDFTANAAKGGFGGEDSKFNVKMSDRGKVASRPGPMSRKEMKKQAEQQKMMKDAVAAAQVAPTTPGTEPKAPATPVSSASSAASSSQNPAPSQPPPIQETPQVVVDRMFKRMVVCAAGPILLGLALFPVFLYLKTTDEDFPLWIVYVAQTLTFGGGLLGITYGILSTSWDPNRDGSFFGFTEFKANLPVLLNRGKN